MRGHCLPVSPDHRVKKSYAWYDPYIYNRKVLSAPLLLCVCSLLKYTFHCVYGLITYLIVSIASVWCSKGYKGGIVSVNTALGQYVIQ